MLSFFANTLVLAGAVILIGALVSVTRLIGQLPQGSSRKSWYTMTALIAIFVIGYVFYIAAFWKAQTNPLDMIVPVIFFFGACFVWLSATLSLNTASNIMRISLLEHESLTDSLTGLFNRRYMDQRLVEEVAAARRYDRPLAVLLLDLDHFKHINDQYGHPTGDQVLIAVGALVATQLRGSDVLARYGGEEFIVIAPNTPLESAMGLAERLRACIESHQFDAGPSQAAKPGVRLTVSIGVACFSDRIDSLERLLKIADRNLYQAKDNGRNQIVADPRGIPAKLGMRQT
ncbi:GGDEF domain-containing protein [Desulfosarcina sp.]|uniref:GGDEF domain-containing protein n=1 Tax=Desulfosarcina sp. TaxID=2027861 RepID=UPI0035681C6F